MVLPPALLQALPPSIAPLVQQHELEVVVAVSLILATLLLLLLSRARGGGAKGSTVLLVGPCGAGKTTLFFQVRDGDTHVGTVASMAENEGSWTVLSDKGRPLGPVRVVDLPGHPRLRHKMELYLRDARAVVVVVDAADITPHKTEAAEELFEVLTHPRVARGRVPVLIACNKMDLETQAHSIEFIRRTLEKQLDTMRRTRAALAPDVASKVSCLGKADTAFAFAALRAPVALAGVSADKGDVKELHSFLSRLI